MERRQNEKGLTALLISPDRELAQQFAASVASTRSFQILADLKTYPARNTLDIRLRQLKPKVILIDVASDLEAACDLIRFASSLNTGVQMVGLHRENDSGAVIRVLRLGASEFLYAPFDPAVQQEAVARLLRLKQPDASAPSELGKVVVMASSKPGSGTSTLAVHVAHSISKTGGRRVLLVDLDLEGGAIAFYLKLHSSYSVVDVLEQADRLDAGIWSSMTVHSAGMDVLLAPEDPYTGEVDPVQLHDLLEYARTAYDWVIVDAPNMFHRVSLMALSESDKAYLVTTSDLASLHLARRAINLVTQIGFGKDRYQVVVNRLNRKDGIGGGDLEKIFSTPIHATIPSDYFALHRVISLGQALAPDCELGKSIAAFAAKIAGNGGSVEKRGVSGLTETRPALSRA
jgi:pilus assembly protein CpaE